jgi:uncharacterized protein (UPF0335 family)
MDVTISVPGHKPVHTTTEGIERATEALQSKRAGPGPRFAKDHLKAFVERIERLEEEKKALSDIRDIYAEAKSNGFDVKALRQVVKLRKQDVGREEGARGDPRDVPACAGDAVMGFHGPVIRECGAVEPGTLSHNALAHDLAMFLSTPPRGTNRGRLTWENIGFPDYMSIRPDVFSLVATLTRAKWCPITYEVKVSRADFTTELRTAKWRLYLPFSAYVYLACPDGLVSADELPPEMGLIVRRQVTWLTVKKGKRNPHWQLKDRDWMNLCLKGRNPSPMEIYEGRIAARRQEVAA